MAKRNINSKSGFTIIEVVLVLAIAGLIFLMVFVALPALQRSQRDTRRTDDMGRVQSSLMNWQNNHNNKLPEASQCIVDDSGGYSNNKAACQFIQDYMNSASDSNSDGNTFVDPSGAYYSVVITGDWSKTTDATLGAKSVEANDHRSAIETDNSAKTVKIASDADFDAHVMWVIPGATCQEDHAVSSAKNNFAVLYRMEGSGVKCTNNGS